MASEHIRCTKPKKEKERCSVVVHVIIIDMFSDFVGYF